LEEQPPCEVWLCGAADEEHAYRGVLKLCEGLRADGAVVAEPTSLRLVVATKGCLRFRIRTHGVAAHSSKPHLGVNAISHMALVIMALEEDATGLARRTHPLLGQGTFNVGTIHGGTQINIVPDACAIEIDRRLLPGEEADEVLGQYRELVAGIQGVEAEVDDPLLLDYPLETSPDEGVARAAARALEGLGLDPTPCGVPYGSDASKLARAGLPAIVAGPGSIDQAHAAVEYIECAQVEQAVEFYRRLILNFE
jgi:acetylornithine deacetylase